MCDESHGSLSLERKTRKKERGGGLFEGETWRFQFHLTWYWRVLFKSVSI